MNQHAILKTLKDWLANLESMNRLPVCFSDDQQTIDARLAERQQIIDSLQLLDGKLTEIRALRASKWTDFPSSTVEKFESLIQKGNVILATCAARDKESLDIATNLRKEVSGKITNLRKSKGYLVTSHVVKKSSSVIVDSHA
jgi:hypothetical protein